MRKYATILLVGALALGVAAAPVSATVTVIPVHCDETLVPPGWTGGRAWLDDTFVYHVRGQSAEYDDVGSIYCAGVNHATVSVNLDLTTGEGMVIAFAHRELDAFDGGWDSKLVAHMTPGSPDYIWVGEVTGRGYGELEGYQYRSTVYELTHSTIVEDGFVFLPGS
jgi:hypothetical protein